MDKFINNCRLCFHNELEKIFDFGNIALGNNLSNSIDEILIFENIHYNFKNVLIVIIFS